MNSAINELALILSWAGLAAVTYGTKKVIMIDMSKVPTQLAYALGFVMGLMIGIVINI